MPFQKWAYYLECINQGFSIYPKEVTYLHVQEGPFHQQNSLWIESSGLLDEWWNSLSSGMEAAHNKNNGQRTSLIIS